MTTSDDGRVAVQVSLVSDHPPGSDPAVHVPAALPPGVLPDPVRTAARAATDDADDAATYDADVAALRAGDSAQPVVLVLDAGQHTGLSGCADSTGAGGDGGGE